MNSPSTLVTQTQPESPNKERVEAHLRKLQDSNRLAMHVWEQKDHNNLPRSNLDILTNVPLACKGNEQSPSRFALSASLLPSTSSGKSIHPYNAWEQPNTFPAYLFDLSQNDENSPRILRAFPSIILSGSSYYNKNISLKLPSRYEALDALYAPWANGCWTPASERHAMLKATSGEKGREFSAKQLDVLGALYALDARPDASGIPPPENGVFGANEVVTTADRSHLVGLAFPIYAQKEGGASHAENLLAAAAYGLEQLDAGLDAPVVLYHIDGPEQGKCTYLAQGGEELAAIFRHALPEVVPCFEAAYNAPRDSDEHKRAVQLDRIVARTTGIELTRPLETQQMALSLLSGKALRQAYSKERSR